MEIGLGVFSGECLPEEGTSHTEVLADSLAQMRLAEDVGLDEVWITEHHFLRSGYVGSVLPYAAAAATATRRIRIGVSVALAPLYDPVRLAEDAAFVDVLSGGRHDLGIAIGYRDVEYEGFQTTTPSASAAWRSCACWCASAGARARSPSPAALLPPRDGGLPQAGAASGGADPHGGPRSEGARPGGPPGRRLHHGRRHRLVGVRRAGPRPRHLRAGGGDGRSSGAECLARYGRPTEAPRFYLTLGGFLHEDGPDAAWAVLQEAYMFTAADLRRLVRHPGVGERPVVPGAHAAGGARPATHRGHPRARPTT